MDLRNYLFDKYFEFCKRENSLCYFSHDNRTKCPCSSCPVDQFIELMIDYESPMPDVVVETRGDEVQILNRIKQYTPTSDESALGWICFFENQFRNN